MTPVPASDLATCDPRGRLGDIQVACPEIAAREATRDAEWVDDRRRHRIAKALYSFRFERCRHAGGGQGCDLCAADFMTSGKLAEVLAAFECEIAHVPYSFQLGQLWYLPIGPAMGARIQEIDLLVSSSKDPRVRYARYEMPVLVPEAPEMRGLVVAVEGRAGSEVCVVLRPCGCQYNPGVPVPVDYLVRYGRLG